MLGLSFICGSCHSCSSLVRMRGWRTNRLQSDITSKLLKALPPLLVLYHGC